MNIVFEDEGMRIRNFVRLFLGQNQVTFIQDIISNDDLVQKSMLIEIKEIPNSASLKEFFCIPCRSGG